MNIWMTPGAVTGKFQFGIQVEMKIHEELKSVIPVVTINIRKEEENEELASIAVSSIFEIVDFEQHIVKNDKGLYTIPQELELALRPIAISTTRGVMFSEFRGTHLHNAILPIIYFDPKPEEQAPANESVV
jgi:ABC-type Fe3+-citrate transport system substrate-binding protein